MVSPGIDAKNNDHQGQDRKNICASKRLRIYLQPNTCIMKATRILLPLLMATQFVHAQPAGHYADVNGIHMYYEVHGTGTPLVLLHGGGSTIRTSFGRIWPRLAKTHQV